MGRVLVRTDWCVGCALALIAAGCTPALCDRASAEAALAAASAGETVELGACELEGPLHVPPGVTLAGRDGTVVVAPPDSGAIVVLGGEPPSRVVGLDVRVEGRIGILARGGGRVAIEDVRIDAARGIALGATGLTELVLARVTAEGPIDATTAIDPAYLRVIAGAPVAAPCPDASCECTPGDVRAGEACDTTGRWATVTATHGIYVSTVDSLVAEDVDVIGFAEHGVVLQDTSARWERGSVASTLGTGLRQVRGTLTATDLVVERTYAGLRGEPPYGIAVTDAGRFDSTRLTLSDNARYGLMLVGATGSATSMIAERNGDAAVWLAGTDDFLLTDGRLADNRFASVVVIESSGVHVTSTSIDRTRAVELAGLRPFGVVRLGDGVHLRESTSDVLFMGVALRENERAGLVLDLGPSGTPDVTFTGVAIEGTGTQLGALAGRITSDWTLSTETPAGWDSGITRRGDTVANDAAFSGTVDALDLLAPAIPSPADVVGVVAPMF